MRPSSSSVPWPVRGVMLDPARLIERHEFYFELLEHMARWGLNTLWWHFTDDQGFMLGLRQHPELASPHAFSQTEMKRFLEAARSAGIDVVPEVESLGHTRRVTGLKEYAELADGDEHGFNAICPSHRRTLPLLKEIIAEVAQLFPSRYFHAGMDEVNVGNCPRCRRRRGGGGGKPRWWIYAEHVKAVHEIVRSLGKEMIIWADHVENDPEMLEVLPKDIIMAHWHYTAVRPEAIRRSLAAGFRVIGCPALCHWGDVVMPNAANFENMEAMVKMIRDLGALPMRPVGASPVAEHGLQASRATRSAGVSPVLGIVNTWWTSWRGLRDAYLPVVAYTGQMLAKRRPVDKLAFGQNFMRDFFRLGKPAPGAAAGAWWRLTECGLTRQELHACLFDSPADAGEALRLAADERRARRAARAQQATETLRGLRVKVRAHRPEFGALVLGGQIAAASLARPAELAKAMGLYRQAKHRHDHGHRAEGVLPPLLESADILERMRRQLRPLLRAAVVEWDRTRYKDDYRRGLGGSWRGSGDALLVRLDKADRFLAGWLRQFENAIRAYPYTDRFPLGV